MDFGVLWEILSGYPTGIYSVLIGVLLVFWLVAILGAIDIDIVSFDTDIEFDADIDINIEGDVPAFIGLLHTLGFTGVPFTIVLTVLIFLAWVFTYLVSAYVLPFIPTDILRILAGTATIIGSFVLAVPFTTKIVSPLRKLALENMGKSNKDYLGAMCKVTSSTVDETFGQGEINDKGAGLIVRIRAPLPNDIKKGDIVRPINYDKNDNLFHVITHKEFEANLD